MAQHARIYGWRRDLPDQRDHQHAPRFALSAPLPPSCDLSGTFPGVYDQGQLGSCTANAGASLVHRAIGWLPSRLAIYYAERAIDPTCLIGEDSGASLRDCAKVLSKYGSAPENMWPYDVARFTTRPPKSFYAAALKHRALSYAKVPQTHDAIRRTLAGGDPIMFGFSVYESFESDEVAGTGLVPMPRTHETMFGGHAVVVCGYDDATNLYTVRNSWGTGWGMHGYCKMPYAYLESPGLASDFWVVGSFEP